MSDPTPEKEAARAYIDGLTEAATPGERGAFSIDPAKARELLRSFYLADPPAFVAELLQAAVLGGATFLNARITRTSVELDFDGQAFDAEDLRLADSALLSDQSEPRQQRLARLAAGLCGAAQLSPRSLRVRSRSGSGTVELQRWPDAPDRLSRSDEPGTGTCIEVVRRCEPPDDADDGWEPPEADRLDTLGGFAPISVRVNGRSVSGGLALPHAAFSTPIEGEGFRGLAGIVEKAQAPAVRLVQHGAVIASEPLDAAPTGFVAVVEAPRVQRDLGLGQARFDAHLEAVLAAVRDALGRVLAAAVQTAGRHPEGEIPDHLALARRTVRSGFLQGAFPDAGRIQYLSVWPVLAALGDADHATLAAVEPLAQRTGGLPFVTQELGAFDPEARTFLLTRRGILRLESAADAERLGQRLGVPVIALDPELPAATPLPVGSWARRRLRPLGWVGLALALATFVIIPAGTAHFHWKTRRERTWPTTPARVTSATPVRKVAKQKQGVKVSHYVSVSFEYDVQGRTYHRSEERFQKHDSAAAARRHATSLLRDGFAVRYDPGRPGLAKHGPVRPEEALYAGAALGGLMLFFLIVWTAHIRSQQRAASQNRVHSQVARLEALLPPTQPASSRRRRRRR